MLISGTIRLESERLNVWRDPDGREQQRYGHLFPPPPEPDVVPAPPTPESHLPLHLVRILVSFSLRVNVV